MCRKNNVILRDYQSNAISELRSLYANGARSICMVAPTGAGKTVIGAAIARSATHKGQNVLWLAHRHELVDQARDAIDDGHVRVDTVQGLLASGDRPPASVVILDECHHYVADKWSAVANSYVGALRIGLTATPERGDGTALGDMFDSLVVAATPQQLLHTGRIVPCEIYAPTAQHSTLSANPCDIIPKCAGGTIVFCKTVEEAREIARKTNSFCVDGETACDVRTDIVDSFRSGKIDTVTNVFVFTEGFDAPSATTCIIARGVSHVGTYLQIAGRVLRPYPGKTHAVIYDLCGSVHKYGFPTDDRTYSLSGTAIGSSAERLPLWKCKHCGFCTRNPPGNKLCKFCNKKMPIPEAIKIQQRKLRRIEHAKLATDAEKATYKQALAQTARAKGYDYGWIAHRFRWRFGHWPD